MILTQTSQAWLQRRGRSAIMWRNTFSVFTEDIPEFSRKLYRNMQNLMNESNPVFCLCSFGQSAQLSTMLTILDGYNSSDLIEVILHIASDIQATGKVPLWNRTSLTNLFKGIDVLEYYVCGIPGFGNYSFLNLGRSELLTENELLVSKSVQQVKFYSSFAKYFHIEKSKPFTSPCASSDLIRYVFNPFKSKYLLKKFRFHLEDLKSVEAFISRVPDTRFYARCELLMNIPVTDNFSSMLRGAADEAWHTFERIKLYSCLRMFNSDSIANMLKQNLFPCINTLRKELEIASSALASGNQYYVSMEGLVNLLTSEMIIGFQLRGLAISTHERRRHDNAICRAAGLVKSNFEIPLSRSPIVFKNNDRLIATEFGVHHTIDKDFVPFDLKHIKIGINYEFQDLMNDIICGIDYKRACDNILHFIKLWTSFHVGNRSVKVIGKRSLLQKAETTRIKILNGYHGVKYLTTTFVTPIKWVILECEKAIGSSNLIKWRIQLARALEESAIRRFNTSSNRVEEKFFCLPGSYSHECAIIIPFVSVNHDNLAITLDIIQSATRMLGKKISMAGLEEVYLRRIEGYAEGQGFESLYSIEIDSILEVLCQKPICLMSARALNATFVYLFADPFPY